MRKINYRPGMFSFNGHSSKDLGLCVTKAPDLNRPARQFNTYNIPGRNGTIIEQLDAFENVKRTYEVFAANNDYAPISKEFTSISEWLYTADGYCRLEDDFEPEIFRLAYFTGPLDVDNQLNLYGKTEINFSCRPERFLLSGDSFIDIPHRRQIVMWNIVNPTKFAAKPLIVFEVNQLDNSSSQVNEYITIETPTGKIDVHNISETTYIDCEEMRVYTDSGEKNSDATGVFPTIPPGEQTIRITSNVYAYIDSRFKVRLKPRWYTI